MEKTKTDKLITLIGGKNRYQYVLVVILIFFSIGADFPYLFMPLISSKPIVTYIDNSTKEKIVTHITYEICENYKNNFEVVKEKTIDNWSTYYGFYCNKLKSSLIMTSFFAGAALSLLVLQKLTIYAKERLILIIQLVYCVSNLLLIIKSYELLIVLCFTHGFCQVSSYILKNSIFIEFLSKDKRHYFQGLLNIYSILISLVCTIVYTNMKSWHLVYFVASLYQLIFTILLGYILVINPRFYLLKGDIKSAVESAIYIAKFNNKIIINDIEINNEKNKNFESQNILNENFLNNENSNIEENKIPSVILTADTNLKESDNNIDNINNINKNYSTDECDNFNINLYTKFNEENIENIKFTEKELLLWTEVNYSYIKNNLILNKRYNDRKKSNKSKCNNINSDLLNKETEIRTVKNFSSNNSFNKTLVNGNSISNESKNNFNSINPSNLSVVNNYSSNNLNEILSYSNNKENKQIKKTNFKKLEDNLNDEIVEKELEEEYIAESHFSIKRKKKRVWLFEKNYIMLFLILITFAFMHNILFIEVNLYSNDPYFKYVSYSYIILNTILVFLYAYLMKTCLGRRWTIIIVGAVALILRTICLTIFNYTPIIFHYIILAFVISGIGGIHLLVTESFTNKTRVSIYSIMYLLVKIALIGLPSLCNYSGYTLTSIYFIVFSIILIMCSYFVEETNNKELKD